MQLKPMAIGSMTLCSKGLSDEDRRLTGIRVVESLGVIGPQRMDYGRVIPLVGYCSDAVTRKLNA